MDAPHAVFGDTPWTQQSGGCGVPGDFIRLGVDFLRTANSTSSGKAGRILAGEWAKFRWGVFSEVGYPHDPLYPPWYPSQSTWAPTMCSNARTLGPICLPDISHHCPWPPNALINVTSSLLSISALPNVSINQIYFS